MFDEHRPSSPRRATKNLPPCRRHSPADARLPVNRCGMAVVRASPECAPPPGTTFFLRCAIVARIIADDARANGGVPTAAGRVQPRAAPADQLPYLLRRLRTSGGRQREAGDSIHRPDIRGRAAWPIRSRGSAAGRIPHHARSAGSDGGDSLARRMVRRRSSRCDASGRGHQRCGIPQPADGAIRAGREPTGPRDTGRVPGELKCESATRTPGRWRARRSSTTARAGRWPSHYARSPNRNRSRGRMPAVQRSSMSRPFREPRF